MDLVEVKITFGTKEKALEITNRLVDQSLIACANIFPVSSVFRWKGEKDSADEYMVEAKTDRANLDAIAAIVDADKDYDLYSITASPIIVHGKSRLDWLRDSIRISSAGLTP